jgi:hypothetical protein
VKIAELPKHPLHADVLIVVVICCIGFIPFLFVQEKHNLCVARKVVASLAHPVDVSIPTLQHLTFIDG